MGLLLVTWSGWHRINEAGNIVPWRQKPTPTTTAVDAG
jgi:hypothetical protein